MIAKAKLIIIDVKQGEKRDYAQCVDIENGGIFALSGSKGIFDSVKKLETLELVLSLKGGRYGFEVLALRGGE